MIEFLGIGAQKAATTWLTENLKSHPQVWMPGFAKELHYFDVLHFSEKKDFFLKKMEKRCTASIEKMRRAGKSDPARVAYLEKVYKADFAFTDEWYRHVFSAAPAGKLRGEYTPLYAALDEKGIEHVKRLMPEVKLIHIVRDPVERTLSSLRMALERAQGKRSQQDVLSNAMFWQRGNYARNIPAWDSAFSAGQILYLSFGRVKTEPQAVLRDVETFLGLKSFNGYPSVNEQVHRTGKFKIEIEDESRRAIEEMSEPQYNFLRQRFGEQFVAQSK